MKTYLRATSNLPCYRALLASCFLREPSIAAAIAVVGPLAGSSTVRRSVHFAHLHRLASLLGVTREVSLSHGVIDANA